MSDHVAGAVVSVIEVVGSSTSSFSDAVRNAVRTASQTIRNITGVEVVSSTADVGDDGELTLYKANCKVAFLLERGDGGARHPDLAELAAREPAEPPYVESGGPDLDR